jgi:hypothetical protein
LPADHTDPAGEERSRHLVDPVPVGRVYIVFLGPGGQNQKQEVLNQERKHTGEGERAGYVRSIAQSSGRKRAIALGGGGGGGRRVGSSL